MENFDNLTYLASGLYHRNDWNIPTTPEMPLDLTMFKEENKIVATVEPQSQVTISQLTKEEKNNRIRLQNNDASLRYRQRKTQFKDSIKIEIHRLESNQKRLKEKEERLTKLKDAMKIIYTEFAKCQLEIRLATECIQ